MKNPFKAIRAYFQGHKDVLEKSYFELEQPDFGSSPEEERPLEAEQKAMLPTEAKPNWLQDEGAVCDEAVIFGLTDVGIDEKLKTIESFFAGRAAAWAKEVELLSERIGEHNLAMERLERQVAEKRSRIAAYTEQTPKPHQLPGRLASLLFSLAMSAGTFALVDFVLKAGFPDRHIPIAGGVFFAGMFSLFSGRTIFHDSEKKMGLRRILKELLPPLSASFFVFAYAWPQVSAQMAWALLFFVFSLFLFSGKLLLENISVIRDHWQIWRENRAIHKRQGKGINDLDNEIERLEGSLDAIRVEKWKIIPELNKLEKELSALASKKTAMVYLFESEFKLARSYRDKLNPAQIKKIVG